MRICPKYLQNSHMVLSYFGITVSENLYCLTQFFSAKEPAGIYGKLSSFSASYKNVRSKFFFQPIFIPKTLVIYFESCKESELVNSILSKGNLSLTY